jgi:two-component system sensor histidine kinase DesK
MSQTRPHPTRYMRYVWLVYLLALFYQPAFDPTTDALDWLAVAVLIAAFLPIYAATFRARDNRQTLTLVIALAALAVVGSLVNGGASVFAIYAAAAAGRLHPTRRAVQVVAALFGIVALLIVISPVPMPWRLAALAPALFFTPVIGATSIFEAERDRANERLVRANQEIERLATIAERERIARDLHDLLGHTLSVIVLKSELAERLIRTDPDRASAEVKDIEHIGREALGEVRAAVTGYRARALDAELAGARVALDAAGIDVQVRADPTDLPPEQESALAMALREAVTNVVRHADAQRATILITTVGAEVRLEVTDDGRGASGPEGSGLSGMRERITALGGHVDVRNDASRNGGRTDRRGTVVEVTVPLLGTADGERQAEEVGGR